MENRAINGENDTTTTVQTATSATTAAPATDLNTHYKQHFQQHFASTAAAAAGAQPLNPPPAPPQQPSITYQTNPNFGEASFPNQPIGGGGSMNDAYESRVQVVESDGMGNVRKIEEKREQHSKRTTQTTTTTTSTSTQQPTVLLNSSELRTTPVHFADPGHHHLTYVQQPVPVYAVTAAPCVPIPVMPVSVALATPPPQPLTYTTTSGNISVEHYPQGGHFSWSKADTYMHIFLTFYFGHFAAMLFFDGIIRNFVNLYLFEHRNMSMLIYILHIILSIALLAFCVWFLTICWRWWRNKSLLPMYGLPYYDQHQRPLGPKERQATFHGCVFTAAVILIISFFCYLVLGVLDLAFKRQLNSYYYSSSPDGHYHRAAYIGDLVVFILRLVFWVVGIVVTLMLSRDTLFKFCCPERRIRIDKERPTTVYEVRNTTA